MKKFYLYILKCSDDSFYIGHNDDLEKRLAQHTQADISNCYTASRLPVKLVYAEALASRIEALSAEQKIKRWTRKKKEALISQNWELVSQLAKKKF